MIGEFEGGEHGTVLVVHLGVQATPEAVQASMRAVTYANTSDNPPTTDRLVRLAANDGAGGEGSA